MKRPAAATSSDYSTYFEVHSRPLEKTLFSRKRYLCGQIVAMKYIIIVKIRGPEEWGCGRVIEVGVQATLRVHVLYAGLFVLTECSSCGIVF